MNDNVIRCQRGCKMAFQEQIRSAGGRSSEKIDTESMIPELEGALRDQIVPLSLLATFIG